MYYFGTRSKRELLTCHEKLQKILNDAIAIYDFSILCGHRGKAAQNKAFENGFSKVKFPDSEHNYTISRAIDIAPWPIDWEDENRYYFLAGIMMSVAKEMDIGIIWGGDWDRDNDFNDQEFMDIGHFELAREE